MSGSAHDKTIAAAFAPRHHDHEDCVREALEAAAALCLARGERLTALRRVVLRLVWSSHRPIGAYEILEHLQQSRGRAAPPTVYRALEFLTAQGLVHRIESLNAFVGCSLPGEAHRACFLICSGCRSTAEVDDRALRRAMSQLASRAGFRLLAETVELSGLCPECGDGGGH